MACNRELSFPISMEAKKSLYVSKLHAFDVIVSSAKNASTFEEFLANSNNGLRVCLNHSSPRAFSTQPNGKIYLHPNGKSCFLIGLFFSPCSSFLR